MRFVTRNGVNRISSYELYLHPYDVLSWIGILTTSLFIPLVFIFNKVKGTDELVSRVRTFLEVVWINNCLLLTFHPPYTPKYFG